MYFNKIAETLTQKFVIGEYDKIELVYNQFKNAATQIVKVEQFNTIRHPSQRLTERS